MTRDRFGTVLILVLLLLACEALPTEPGRRLALSDCPPPEPSAISVVQQASFPGIEETFAGQFDNPPQVGSQLVAVLGTLHDSVMSVSEGWTLRVPKFAPGQTLYVYERTADGSAADLGVSFTLSSPDGRQLTLLELSPATLDAWSHNAVVQARATDPQPTSVSTGTASNTLGTFALAVVYRDEQHAYSPESEPISGWTNGFEEIVDYYCCNGVQRSRMAIAVRAVGPGPVETSASWNPVVLAPRGRLDATAAVVTYGSVP